MRAQQFWVVAVDRATYDAERLYANETLVLPAPLTEAPAGELGDRVALLVADDAGGSGAGMTPPAARLFGVGVVTAGRAGVVTVRYTHRLFDLLPSVAIAAPAPDRLSPVGAEDFDQLIAGVGPDNRVDADRREWFVSVALPIEAASRAEAVREFWTYVDKLGPRELPAYVWPRGDELAMQAYLLGEQTNEDPEEDDAP